MNSSPKAQPTPDARIAAFAARRHNVVTAAELRALGVNDAAIKYRLRVGRLHRHHQGVYSVGTGELTPPGRFLAAVRAVGDGAALSHRAAVAHHGLRALRRAELDRIDVSVARARAQRPGIRLHVVRLDPADVTVRDGIPVTTVPRTLVDLAGVLSANELRRVVNEALVQRRVTVEILRGAVDQARGRRGIAVVRALLPQAAPTRSELEDRMLAFLARLRLPRPVTNVEPSGIPYEVDFLFPDLDLVIETDGAQFHDTPLARRHDARKQAVLEAAGFRVLRVRSEQIGEQLTAVRIRRVVEEQRVLCETHKKRAAAPATSPVRWAPPAR